MIRSIDIQNFRCFEHLRIEGCRRINVAVGDNGSGKTALMEAIFLALGVTPEIGIRYRQQRGLEGQFSGPFRRVEEAIWRDLFHKRDWRRPIVIELEGEGPESRTLSVSLGAGQLTIPLGTGGNGDESRLSPVTFVWRDRSGVEHKRVPKLTPAGLVIDGDEEDLPDFFMFPANQLVSSSENAARFSDLSRADRTREFVGIFTREYPWIKDLSIEVLAGLPVIYATLRDTKEKLPLPLVSGGINRILGIMLAIASRSGAIVVVDEVDNGIYHRHNVALCRAMLLLARSCDAQLFLTTHNEEWLEALFDAASGDVSDIAFWRIERSENGPLVRQFSGRQAELAIAAGEVR